MKNNAKKARSAVQQPLTIDHRVNYGMENGTLPPASVFLHMNDSHQHLAPTDSSMNQYSDVFSSRQSLQTNSKNNNKRKLDELCDPSLADLDSSSSIKPQKTEQNEPERANSRAETPLSNGPPTSSTPSRNSNDIGPPSYEFVSASNNNGSTTPNPSMLGQQTSPIASMQHQQSMPQPPPPPPPPSYMHMSPRNQYNMPNDSPFLQTNNQVFVFTTMVANEAAESVLKNDHPNIIEYHKSLPSTAQYLSSLSNNNHNPMLGGPMHMNLPPGCHSPRTMQMMMPGPPHHHHPHAQMHNGGIGPPPNWSHPHFHQQQPPFGRLTPGSGGMPPSGHLMPPGAVMMNGSMPSPGMRMGGMPPMPGMGQSPSDGIENLTPERAKHRKNQLNKIEDLKTKITGGRGRGGRAKANAAAAAAAAAAATANMPPSMNGGQLPPGALDPHQQHMMMMNSPHGGGPPHHMMGIGPPPPHMLPPGMRGPPDGMMLDMNGHPLPPHGYMNGPMPPGFHGQFGPGPNDHFGQLPPPHQHSQAARDWNKMQMEHIEGKVHHMRGQPPPYSSTSPSGLTPPIASTSAGNIMGPNGKLLSPRMDSCTTPRLYKVGQPEKFIPDSLPSSANKPLPGAVGEVRLTASPTPMDYNEFGMSGEELSITRHLNRAYRSGNGSNIGPPMPSSSSSSCKDEPMTPSTRSTSTPNNNSTSVNSGQQPPPPMGSTTPTHYSQGPPSHLSSQNMSVASPRASKMSNNNNNLSSPLMLSNTNSTKDEPLDMNGDPKTPSSNMAPPLSSMLQMTNSLQSSNSPYNPTSNNNPGSKSSLPSPNLGHPPKQQQQQPPMDHMNMPPQYMQYPPMNSHHRMLGPPPDSMPPHYNPHHPSHLPPPHPHMYRMMSPHHSMDPNGMMMPHSGGPSRSSKGLLMPPGHPSDPMQQHLHHLPPPHYIKMHNMDPSLGPPLPGHPQQHMRFSPMMDDGFAMGPPHHHPHMHPHMHGHHPMHLNDGRPPQQQQQQPPPPQAINNTYVSATMSIQQLNIQNVGPGGPPGDLQAGTIHYHAPSANGPDSQQQQFQPHDPSFSSQFNDMQGPPSNLSADGAQSQTYW